MIINSWSKAIITFDDEELDTIDRVNEILESIRAELNHQDIATFEVNGTCFNRETVEAMIMLCYDLSNDCVTIKKDDNGER